MNVYTCIDHDYFWPVGVASVVIANSEDEAREILAATLTDHGLKGTKPFTLHKIDTSVPQAVILCDGDY